MKFSVFSVFTCPPKFGGKKLPLQCQFSDESRKVTEFPFFQLFVVVVVVRIGVMIKSSLQVRSSSFGL